MIEELPDVPPALLLLLNEVGSSASWVEARRRIKGMLADLRQQSEAFQAASIKRQSYSRDPMRFDVHLHGALDLLSSQGCAELKCRVKAADRVARSVGLVADRVWLTDHLSDQFVDFGRATNAKLDQVVSDIVVLARLLPLIIAGVVRFRSPWIATCSACAQEFNRQLTITSKEVGTKFRRDFRIERLDGGGFVAHTGRCFDPPMHLHSPAGGKSAPSAAAFAQEYISDQLRSVFWVAREASMAGGAIFSNSRIGLAGLLQQEGRLVDRRSLLLMDKEREINVPWVSELDAAQIVQLREEASNALPAFREKLAKALSASDQIQESNSSSAISELREQAIEVRSELAAKRKNSSRYWKTTYGLLGLGISAYGVAADQVIPGVGGLLPVIHLLVSHKTGYETDIAKLTSRPGFVLVKAQDILAHAS